MKVQKVIVSASEHGDTSVLWQRLAQSTESFYLCPEQICVSRTTDYFHSFAPIS